jgi:hypothetical protein
VQPVTAELRRWIIAQATAGYPPDIVLDAMKASGWSEQVAIDGPRDDDARPPRPATRGAVAAGRDRAGAARARRRASAPARRRSAPATAMSASSWR